MKAPLLITTLLTTALLAGLAFADDVCHDPVIDWQPKKVLREKLEAEGWQIHRIKVDDGCYEVKGFDQHGNQVKAEFYPASLQLRKLKMKFDEGAVIPDGIYSEDNKIKKNIDMNKKTDTNNSANGERP